MKWPMRQLVKECARMRVDLKVDKHARQSILRRVHKGDVRYARKLSQSRTLIVLDYDDRELALLYSSASHEILCFFPPHAPELSEWREQQAAAKAARRPCCRGEGTPP